MNNQKLILHWTSLIVLYVLIFLMVREWLIPLIQLTNTGHYELFIVFVALCLILDLLKLDTWVTGLIKAVYVFGFLLYVFGGFNITGIQQMIQGLTSGAMALFTGDFAGIGSEFKTLLFLILLWMTVYLIHHWLTIRHSIVYFFMMTVIFLCIIDTFAQYDAKFGIIRVMVFGLFLMGLLYIRKQFKETKVEPTIQKYVLLFAPLVFMLVISTIFAWIMPKNSASENLPAPVQQTVDWINKAIQPTGKVGYSNDDRQLGGGFEEDDTEVIRYTAPKNQYLRVETKSNYTGKGWTRASGDIYVQTFDYDKKIDTSIPAGSYKKKEENKLHIVSMNKSYEFIAQPYGIRTIEETTAVKEKASNFYIEYDSDKIRPLLNDENVNVDDYTVTYTAPKYKLSELKNTQVHKIQKGESYTLNDVETLSNLQLPRNLPKRVTNLATKITEDEKSAYDKAQAIVAYFKSNGYMYARENIARPKNEEDYVDQFLFETKVGYCDNYSTSMVVMLRTLGIPARWVKGFAPGTVVASANDTVEVKVTNNEAHSWVEAYFPEVGWMAFEPTVGFSGFDNVLNDVQKDTSDTLSPEKNNTVKEAQQQKTPKEEIEKEEAPPKEEAAQTKETQKEAPNYIGLLLIGTLLIVGLVLFMLRKYWLPYIIIQKFKRQKEVHIEDAYQVLIKQFARNSLIKQPGETLQQFSERVDKKINSQQMTRFITLYTEYLYSKAEKNVPFDKYQESWEYLIKYVRG